jgi:hypothetical protein
VWPASRPNTQDPSDPHETKGPRPETTDPRPKTRYSRPKSQVRVPSPSTGSQRSGAHLPSAPQVVAPTGPVMALTHSLTHTHNFLHAEFAQAAHPQHGVACTLPQKLCCRHVRACHPVQVATLFPPLQLPTPVCAAPSVLTSVAICVCSHLLAPVMLPTAWHANPGRRPPRPVARERRSTPLSLSLHHQRGASQRALAGGRSDAAHAQRYRPGRLNNTPANTHTLTLYTSAYPDTLCAGSLAQFDRGSPNCIRSWLTKFGCDPLTHLLNW